MPRLADVKLLTIGEFARASRLSPKALRLYDELGLLRPCPGRRVLRLPVLLAGPARPGAAGRVAAPRRPAARDDRAEINGRPPAEAAAAVTAFLRVAEADFPNGRGLLNFCSITCQREQAMPEPRSPPPATHPARHPLRRRLRHRPRARPQPGRRLRRNPAARRRRRVGPGGGDAASEAVMTRFARSNAAADPRQCPPTCSTRCPTRSRRRPRRARRRRVRPGVRGQRQHAHRDALVRVAARPGAHRRHAAPTCCATAACSRSRTTTRSSSR